MGLTYLNLFATSLLYVFATFFLWRNLRDKKFTAGRVILVGVLYGGLSVFSTHFSTEYERMLLNVRDLGPLAAGLFFHPISGFIAGLIGGIERYIVGEYMGIGYYTHIACAVSTIMAGFIAMTIKYLLLKEKHPLPIYSFFVGIVQEVFHMYMILVTHRTDIWGAYEVIRVCSFPMIFFTGFGLALCSASVHYQTHRFHNPLKRRKPEEVHIARHFQTSLFFGMILIFLLTFSLEIFIMGNTTIEDSKAHMDAHAETIRNFYSEAVNGRIDLDMLYKIADERHCTFDILFPDGTILVGKHIDLDLDSDQYTLFLGKQSGEYFEATFWDMENALCRKDKLIDGNFLLMMMENNESHSDLNLQVYETAYEDILLISGVYVLISIFVQVFVVDKLDRVNESLYKITNGDLNEVVNVRSCVEFATLSDDINETVDVLKGYIGAAEKRYEEELILAREIQISSLPQNFSFPRNDIEIFATMDPAREVGGDFYDFFFIDNNKFAMIIADVSGKGIPAAMFMMRSKTALKTHVEAGQSPAEAFEEVNRILCEGNEAEMFVTVWIGIIDLKTGLMECANAGHEYPTFMHSNGKFELVRDKHSLPLAAMPELKTKPYELQLHPGDRLFVYTDGVPEAINEQEEQYGDQRMLQTLNRYRWQNMTDIISKVRENIQNFTGTAPQFDDITMLGFTFYGPEGKPKPPTFPTDQTA